MIEMHHSTVLRKRTISESYYKDSQHFRIFFPYIALVKVKEARFHLKITFYCDKRLYFMFTFYRLIISLLNWPWITQRLALSTLLTPSTDIQAEFNQSSSDDFSDDEDNWAQHLSNLHDFQKNGWMSETNQKRIQCR